MAAIDWTKVSSELRTALEKRLPAGATLEQNVWLCDARIERIEVENDQQVHAALEKAGGPAMITNGKPTIMRVVAWMAHEGINKNRLAFERADLEKAAAKIAEPDFLPMDFNHSAVDGFGFQQKAIGVWYRAEVAQDPQAGGAWGILATGMMWSWLNPDLADRLLAEQARNGRVDFSMACIAGAVTKARNDDGPYEIAHDTTFFTLSALDVPPADPAATGLAVEGSEDPNLESELKQRLTAKAVAAANLTVPRPARTPEAKMEIDALLAQLKTLSEQAAKLVDANMKESIMQAIDTKLAEIKADAAKVAGLEALVADLTAKVADSQGKTAEAEAKVAELSAAKAALELQTAAAADKDVALEASKAEVTKANVEVDRLAAELATVTAALKVFQDGEAEKASAVKAAKRYAELPESYREAFEKRTAEDQTAAKARWAQLDDAAWTAFVADLGVMPVAKSYLARSASEKMIPAASPAEGSIRQRLAQFK